MQTALLQAMVLDVHALCFVSINPQWGDNMLTQGLGLGITQISQFVHLEDFCVMNGVR